MFGTHYVSGKAVRHARYKASSTRTEETPGQVTRPTTRIVPPLLAACSRGGPTHPAHSHPETRRREDAECGGPGLPRWNVPWSRSDIGYWPDTPVSGAIPTDFFRPEGTVADPDLRVLIHLGGDAVRRPCGTNWKWGGGFQALACLAYFQHRCDCRSLPRKIWVHLRQSAVF